ncbi:MAG: hypothetical protein FWC32_08005 [Firmicutes bacterium]|nr:hypothetical protein [Bacillota bacterium]
MVKQPTVINKREDVLSKINEIFPLLSNDDKKIAEDLHNLAIEWNMKIGIGNIRTNAANTQTNYDITYSAKKPSPRSIFMYKIFVMNDNATFGIKPKFTNIDKYNTVIQSCPDNIKNVILNINNCIKHSVGCKGCSGSEIVYTINRIKYNPCRYKGGCFENLTTDEWEFVKNLIIEEYNAHTTV